MSSTEHPEWLDLERDLPTTAEDIAALRLLRRHPTMDLDSYFRFLRSFPAATVEELGRRKGPRGGEPFALPPKERVESGRARR
jgi:hypothetical protein